MHVRPATPEDAAAIARIYNDAIANSTVTFHTEPRSVEDRREWLAAHGENRPVLVALDRTAEGDEADRVVGWAAASDWSDRPGYAPTAEVAVYVEEGRRGGGIGDALLAALIKAAREAGVHVLTAQIVEGNEVSARLHEKHGFVEVGTLREVGLKFGRRLDVLIMQKIL